MRVKECSPIYYIAQLIFYRSIRNYSPKHVDQNLWLFGQQWAKIKSNCIEKDGIGKPFRFMAPMSPSIWEVLLPLRGRVQFWRFTNDKCHPDRQLNSLNIVDCRRTVGEYYMLGGYLRINLVAILMTRPPWSIYIWIWTYRSSAYSAILPSVIAVRSCGGETPKLVSPPSRSIGKFINTAILITQSS